MAKRVSLADELQEAISAAVSPSPSELTMALDIPAGREGAPSGLPQAVGALRREDYSPVAGEAHPG